MQRKIPAWAPPKRTWPKGFTIHPDGWVKSHQGKTIWVAGKTVDPKELGALFSAKLKIEVARADAIGTELPTPDGLTYAELLGAFLAYKEHEARNNRISMRTLHNYEYHLNEFGNLIGGGRKLAASIGPREFTIVKRHFDRLSKITVESNMAYISALFKWAEGMELIPKFRPGPEWKRPLRKEVRSERMNVSKCFDASEFAKLWRTAGLRDRIWLGLGICAAFTNTDIANLPREVIDFDNGRIDFARRKVGKVRRVTVLPRCVVDMMREYKRPDPVDAKFDYLFFMGRDGVPLNYANGRHNTNSVSVAFNRLQQEVGIQKRKRGFTGLRTTFYNLCPESFREQRKIIMGRAQGTIDLDFYLERVGLVEIRQCVEHVWSAISSELSDETRTF